MDDWPAVAFEAWDDYGPLLAVALAAVVLAVLVGKWLSED